MMAVTEGMDDTAQGLDSQTIDLGATGRRNRPCSRQRDERVLAVKSAILMWLGPYEPIIAYLQSVLVWERPLHSVFLYIAVNAVFWFFALSSLRMLFLLSAGLASAVCADTWRNRTWPEIIIKQRDEEKSRGMVNPGILSVPELCEQLAEAWVTTSSFTQNLVRLRWHSPGKFCLLVCGFFTPMAMLGCYIPGLVLSYAVMLAGLLCPLAMYHRVWQRLLVHLEPALQWLDFSISGYMSSQPKESHSVVLHQPVRHAYPTNGSDSEEELSTLCPKLDDAAMAKELAITDSEHSDAEVSHTDNGTLNLSRGQSPLTEDSEDLDRHSNPEESFACDLPNVPSIKPEAILMGNDDDTSIGLQSPGSSSSHSPSNMLLDLDQEIIDPKQSSSDQESEDFEVLDQSKLSQMDPLVGSGQGRSLGQHQQHSNQETGFLSNLQRKTQ
ncbi:reticulophagy regulator 3 isoform X2 [Megalops cyprinoides]|uniref:reticulophagy regulator 3 isoform X2 n=1 Tax=Megalops cyprinoides TaxID=118141 RepID=UPI001863A2D1|nr:reticulophagy regulator 3 isoform X2 [Megalops cyprinoides]